jgi:hypothetical protein
MTCRCSGPHSAWKVSLKPSSTSLGDRHTMAVTRSPAGVDMCYCCHYVSLVHSFVVMAFNGETRKSNDRHAVAWRELREVCGRVAQT